MQVRVFVFLSNFLAASILLASSGSHYSRQESSKSCLVTASDYCEFLNAVGAVNIDCLYDDKMLSDANTACIRRLSQPGSYQYEVISGRGDFPIHYVSPANQARYCNWLQQGKPRYEIEVIDLEEGAYRLELAKDADEGDLIYKNSDAVYWIANEKENSAITPSSSNTYFRIETLADKNSLSMFSSEVALGEADAADTIFGFLLPLLLGTAAGEELLAEEELTGVIKQETLTSDASLENGVNSLPSEMEGLQISQNSVKSTALTSQQLQDRATAVRLRDILLQPVFTSTPITLSSMTKESRSRLGSHSDQTARRLFPPTPDSLRQSLRPIEEEVTDLISSTKKIDINAESDASPNSSDDEYGAKTLMRKIARHVSDIEPREYAINQDRTEEITKEEIKENPGKYYIANFRGDHLNYFSSNQARRMYVKQALDSVVSQQSVPCQSIASKNIGKKYKENAQKAARKFSKLNTSEKLKDIDFIKTYKSPAHFSKAVNDVSPEYGNPLISTSKDAKVGPVYADHPKEGATLHPKYSDSKKPKHRLIGMTTVIVHEANEYLKKPKADIEKLRTAKKIGALSAIERKNEEILFAGVLDSQNIAGYVPLAYPNLSKPYSTEDKKLFGLEESKKWSITRSAPKTLGKTAKDDALYPANRRFQWRLAEKYVTDKNTEGELIWVDRNGKFNRFRINQKSGSEQKRTTRRLLTEFEKQAIAAGLLPDSPMLDRIKNPDGFYQDDELNFLMEAELPTDTEYISPAIASVDESFNQALISFKERTAPSLIELTDSESEDSNNSTKKQAVIIIHSNLHFMGIHIVKNPDHSFSITSFDPVVSTDDNKPLHPLPAAVVTSLNHYFPGVPIISTTSKIQTYTSLTEGEFMIDNNHCGPFVAYFMTAMARGNARLALNGTGKIELKFPEEEWITIHALNKKQSDGFGKELRSAQASFLLEEQEKEAFVLDKVFGLVDHYRQDINLCWNGYGSEKENHFLGKATTAFDHSANCLDRADDVYTILSHRDLIALDKKISTDFPEKINKASTLAKNSIVYSSQASFYYRQAGIAYTQGNKEEGGHLEKIAPGYARSARFLIRAVVALQKERQAMEKGKVTLAHYWKQLSALCESVSDDFVQLALAKKEKNRENWKQLNNKLDLQEREIEQIIAEIQNADDGILPLFQLEEGF